jgi:uroporphyrinogen decarboxylase
VTSPHPGLADSPFLRAARGQEPAHTPVWFMRQAGRSLPEYLAVRQGVGMLESCMDPALTTEITLQPVRRYGVDAAIFFSDIVLPLKAVGVDLDIVAGVGPVVASPVRTLADVEAIPDLTPEHALMGKIAGIGAAYLRVQVEAGASAVQLFDSWAGALTPADYAASVMPHSARVLAAAGELGVPRIHFGVGTSNLLGLMGEAGADVVGVDWRTPLASALPLVGDRAVQGNLDPTLVFAPTEVMLDRAREVLEAGRDAKGHVFNLGHGVIPSTDPDQLARLTEFVQSWKR